MAKASTLVDSRGRFLLQYDKVTIICPCGKKLLIPEWRIQSGRGKYCSKTCMYENRRVVSGTQHHFWDGESPKYSALHKWMAKTFGQDMTCEWCGFESDNRFQIHWANITGNYSRMRSDWARLCAKCHYHYDRKGVKHGSVG